VPDVTGMSLESAGEYLKAVGVSSVATDLSRAKREVKYH